MQFPTVSFTVFFLLVLATWWSLPAVAPRARAWTLVLASSVFYLFAGIEWLGVLWGVGVLAWWGCRWIDAAQGRARCLRGWTITALLVVHLGVWKYAQWTVSLGNQWLGPLGFASVDLPEWAYPVGLSFFSFHALAIVLGTWHGRIQRYSFVQVLAQVSFFPCLLAGPVLRADAIAPKLAEPFRFSQAPWLEGILHIALGMGFKWVLSSQAAQWSDPVFSGLASGTVQVWWGVHAYAAQIFFDFAGYSLMALGLARMLGFVLPENFTHPYLATSAQQFWRSWHRSLSFFFRDHLYIDALGGNRNGPAMAMFAAVLTMLVSGLWHGAKGTFLVWGVWHAAWLVAERLIPGRSRWPAWLGWLVSIEIVSWGWVWFRAESIPAAVEVFQQAFGGLPAGPSPTWAMLAWASVMVLVIACERRLLAGIVRAQHVCDAPMVSNWQGVAITAVLGAWAWLVIFLGPVGVPPFIYNGF